MVTARVGHSLVELTVTVVLLTAALAGVGASSVLGARWAGDGLRHQEAVRLAATLLDSLVAAPTAAPGGGSRLRGAWRLRWTVDPMGIAVTAETLEGQVVVTLDGRPTPVVPVLPDLPPVPAPGTPP